LWPFNVFINALFIYYDIHKTLFRVLQSPVAVDLEIKQDEQREKDCVLQLFNYCQWSSTITAQKQKTLNFAYRPTHTALCARASRGA
jgi:hypothetical protein